MVVGWQVMPGERGKPYGRSMFHLEGREVEIFRCRNIADAVNAALIRPLSHRGSSSSSSSNGSSEWEIDEDDYVRDDDEDGSNHSPDEGNREEKRVSKGRRIASYGSGRGRSTGGSSSSSSNSRLAKLRAIEEGVRADYERKRWQMKQSSDGSSEEKEGEEEDDDEKGERYQSAFRNWYDDIKS